MGPVAEPESGSLITDGLRTISPANTSCLFPGCHPVRVRVRVKLDGQIVPGLCIKDASISNCHVLGNGIRSLMVGKRFLGWGRLDDGTTPGCPTLVMLVERPHKEEPKVRLYEIHYHTCIPTLS